MLRKLDLLTPQERKIGLLMVFFSYSSSDISLFIASQFPFHFTYIVLGTSLVSELVFQEKEGKNETRGQTPPEGRIARQLPEMEICVF